MDTPNDLMREEERRKVYENQDWSKLCDDILRPILETLSFLDFHRAKFVCSDWYKVCKTCVKQPLWPWRIIYQDDSLMLYDPREDKIYKTKHVGLSEDSYYMASSGNWLLMVDSSLDFYIFNLLTCKRINLPSMESSILGEEVRFQRSGHLVEPCGKDHWWKDIFGCERSAVLWIDESTEEYVVAWIFNKGYLFVHKKGDDSWWNWNKEYPNSMRFSDLAYKKSKLYLYTINDHIKIIDFSGDYPKEVIEKNPYWDHPFHYFSQRGEYISKRTIAIQKSGEVLIIMSLLEVGLEDRCLFYIFKMNLESNKSERVDSIGDDEMLIFGHGVTIRAPPVQDVGDGIKNGSIFFVKDDVDHFFQIAVSSILPQVESNGLRSSVLILLKLSGFFQDLLSLLLL